MFLLHSDEPNPRITKREETAYSPPHCTQVLEFQMQCKVETLQQAEMNPTLARAFQQTLLEQYLKDSISFKNYN